MKRDSYWLYKYSIASVRLIWDKIQHSSDISKYIFFRFNYFVLLLSLSLVILFFLDF